MRYLLIFLFGLIYSTGLVHGQSSSDPIIAFHLGSGVVANNPDLPFNSISLQMGIRCSWPISTHSRVTTTLGYQNLGHLNEQSFTQSLGIWPDGVDNFFRHTHLEWISFLVLEVNYEGQFGEKKKWGYSIGGRAA
ncbi:MAG: hypothetical protein AAFU03_08215, partial [Bacteroidota bacterium]